MDEFTSCAYNDDSQVKNLSFQSAHFFSKAAKNSLLEGGGLFGGLLTSLMLKHEGYKTISDVTIIELRDISSEMDNTDEDSFLYTSKAGAQRTFG